jgi:hypothetical protein
MERRLRRMSFVSLVRFPPLSGGCPGGRRRKSRDFAMVLMVAAVVGVLCQLAEAIVDVGRSAGWWQ